MMEKLERLFLRYSIEAEGKGELEEELKTEIEQLTNMIGAWSRQVGGLPQQRHPVLLINVCDEAISGALRASDSLDYATALACLRQAHRAVTEIQKAWEANLAYEAARAAYEDLEALFQSSRLKQLLTVENLALLLVQTASLLQRGKYRQGELLARVCQRRSEMLGEQQSIATEALQARLQQLSTLCDEVAGFLPPVGEDWADKSALRNVETLLRDQHCALVEGMLNDLEVEFTPHRTFLAIYRQLRLANPQAFAQPLVSDADLRELIAAQSWSAATSYLLQSSLDELSDKLTEMPAKATVIRQQIAVYHDSTAAK